METNEWTEVYRVNRVRSQRKAYHTDKDCPKLNIGKNIRISRLGSMIAGKFRKCGTCTRK